MRRSLQDLEQRTDFVRRHLGPGPAQQREMLDELGIDSLADLIDKAVPKTIRWDGPLDLPAEMTETEAIVRLREIAERNTIVTSMIGMGYYGTITPPVIQRNVLENPAWYTAYTPIPARDLPGTSRSAAQFPDDGERPHRHGPLQCLAA